MSNVKENQKNIQKDSPEKLINEEGNLDKQSDKESKQSSITRSLCNKCNLKKETYEFSCSHKICLDCMFNFFISNNFSGLNLEFVSISCPTCNKGNVNILIDIWIQALTQIMREKEQNLPLKQDQTSSDINKNIPKCEKHKDKITTKYCNQCQQFLCDLCLQDFHKNMFKHTLIDAKEKINNNISLGYIDNELKLVDQNLQKIENLFYDKIENEYIIKKTKIEDLIRQLNHILDNYTIQMNSFQNDIRKIFYIINLSYYNYYSTKEKERKKDITIAKELLDIKLLTQNMIDINEVSNIFYKKIQDVDTINSKIFDFELLWRSKEPKNSLELRPSGKDGEDIDCVTKIVELKKKNNLASSLINGSIYIWDIKKKIIKLMLKEHKSAVWSMIENDNGTLISGSSDRTIKLWDIIKEKKESIKTLKGHKGTVFCLAKLDPIKIISGSEDKTLKIWDLVKYQCIRTLIDPNNSKINSLITLQDTNFILTGGDDNLIKIWNLEGGFVPNVLKGHDCTVWCLINFADDDLLASGSSDNSIKIWDLISLKCLYSLDGHENTISSLFMMKNDLLASSSWDNTCRLWNLNTRSCIYVLKGHTDIVWEIKELENGDLVSCSNDKKIIIWERK